MSKSDDFKLKEKDEDGYTRYEEVDGYYYEDITKQKSHYDRSFHELAWQPEGRYDT